MRNGGEKGGRGREGDKGRSRVRVETNRRDGAVITMTGGKKKALPNGLKLSRVGGGDGASRKGEGEGGIADATLSMHASTTRADTIRDSAVRVDLKVLDGKSEEMRSGISQADWRWIIAGATRRKRGGDLERELLPGRVRREERERVPREREQSGDLLVRGAEVTPRGFGLEPLGRMERSNLEEGLRLWESKTPLVEREAAGFECGLRRRETGLKVEAVKRRR